MSPAPELDMSISTNPKDNTLTVPRLRDDGSNWVDYKEKVRSAMGSKGVIRHVDGTARAPMPYKEVDGIPVIDEKSPPTPATDEQIEAKEKRLKEYEQKEYTARHILLTTVSKCLAAKLRGKTAHEMWKIVEADATEKSDFYKVDARRRLADMRCDEDGDVRADANALVALRDELAGMGATVSDEEFSSIILGSLPLTYRTYLAPIVKAAEFAGTKIHPEKLLHTIVEEAGSRAGHRT